MVALPTPAHRYAKALAARKAGGVTKLTSPPRSPSDAKSATARTRTATLAQIAALRPARKEGVHLQQSGRGVQDDEGDDDDAQLHFSVGWEGGNKRFSSLAVAMPLAMAS
jgi:hypothetical protein